MEKNFELASKAMYLWVMELENKYSRNVYKIFLRSYILAVRSKMGLKIKTSLYGDPILKYGALV